jgi:hypothetical protein
VLIVTDMVLFNDFIAYDADNETPLSAVGLIFMVAAILFAIAAVRLGFAGNRAGPEKSKVGLTIGLMILGIFALWCCMVLSWFF